MYYDAPASASGVKDPTQVSDYTDEQVMASALPQNIKEAMLRNRIPKLQGLPSKVTPEAIMKLTGAQPKPEPQSRQPQPIRQTLQESAPINSDMITISKSDLKGMINEAISQFFSEAYNKTLTESAIKQTINTLIREGKNNVKKKV